MSKDKKINKHYENLIDGTKIKKIEKSEDATRYGEFISSFDKWTTFENQKTICNHLEKAGKHRGKQSLPDNKNN